MGVSGASPAGDGPARVGRSAQGKIPLILTGGTYTVGWNHRGGSAWRGAVHPAAGRRVTREQIVAVCGACTVAQGRCLSGCTAKPLAGMLQATSRAGGGDADLARTAPGRSDCAGAMRRCAWDKPPWIFVQRCGPKRTADDSVRCGGRYGA